MPNKRDPHPKFCHSQGAEGQEVKGGLGVDCSNDGFFVSGSWRDCREHVVSKLFIISSFSTKPMSLKLYSVGVIVRSERVWAKAGRTATGWCGTSSHKYLNIAQSGERSLQMLNVTSKSLGYARVHPGAAFCHSPWLHMCYFCLNVSLLFCG